MFKIFKEKAQIIFCCNTAHNPLSNDREGIWDGFLLTLSYTKMASISVWDTGGLWYQDGICVSSSQYWHPDLLHPTIKIHAFSAGQKYSRWASQPVSGLDSYFFPRCTCAPKTLYRHNKHLSKRGVRVTRRYLKKNDLIN